MDLYGQINLCCSCKLVLEWRGAGSRGWSISQEISYSDGKSVYPIKIIVLAMAHGFGPGAMGDDHQIFIRIDPDYLSKNAASLSGGGGADRQHQVCPNELIYFEKNYL